jgi:hypothetical protein
MSKISRRDFFKVALAALGAVLLYFIGKQAGYPSVETPTPISTPIAFIFWGQDNLTFATLNMPYHDLR